MHKCNLLLITLILVFSVSVFAGNKASSFTLENMQGEQVSLSDYEGKVVLVDFWATWCPPCRMEIPHFNELYEEYKDQGFEVLGVSLDRGGKPTIDKFLESTAVAYPILLGNNEISAKFQEFVNPDERDAIPFTFIIDKNGEIADVFVGYKEKAVFEKAIVKLLNN